MDPKEDIFTNCAPNVKNPAMASRRQTVRRPAYGLRKAANYETLLSNTNSLLAAAGIDEKKIKTIGELTRVASSMFVAVFESLFHVKVEGIIRAPKTKEDYVANVQRVIDGLSTQIQMDLQHIKGDSIVEGDIRSLSNLIHIFIRIVAITGNQAQSDEGGGHRAIDFVDVESISTHESTFAVGNQNAGLGAGLQNSNAMEAALSFSPAKVRKLCEKDARQLLLTTETQIKQNERTEAARFRRNNLLLARESRCETSNKRRDEVTKRVQQQRWLEDSDREANSYKLRQNHEEQTMLRQIYKGLLQKLHAWRRAERQEAKDNVTRMRDDAKKYIQSLQVLFEDRLKIIREQTSQRRTDLDIFEHAQRSHGSKMRRSFDGENQSKLLGQRDLLIQKRQAQLLKEREGHRHMLSLLATEKWQETLRD